MLTRNFLHSPFNALAEMDRLFENMAAGQLPYPQPGAARRGQIVFPALNLYEDENRIYIEAELPGFTIEGVDVSITGHELSIRGKRPMTLPEGTTSLRRERVFGEFERSIEMPVDIDVEQVEATLTNGVLMITLPKAREAQARKIQVRTATTPS